MADPIQSAPKKSENNAENINQSPAKEIALFNYEWKSEPEDKTKHVTSPEKPFNFTLDPQLAASMATLSVSTNSPVRFDNVKTADPLPPFAKPQEFKICLIGDEQVGKTSYIDRILGDKFNREYEATKQVQVRDVTLETNRGPINFHVWDVAGKNDGLGNTLLHY